MNAWQGKLTKSQAIQLLERITDHDDPYWDYIVEDYYDEDTDTMPSIYHLYDALGITKSEYCAAIDFKEPNNIPWATESKTARIASSSQDIYDALVEVLGYQSLAPADVIKSAEDLIDGIENGIT